MKIVMFSVVTVIVFSCFTLLINSKCLEDEDDLMARYRRSFQNNANNHKAPIVIESSMRASHQIVSHVLNILLEEVIGFTNVIVKDIETMNTTVMLNRIVGCPISSSNLEDRMGWKSCKENIKYTVINLEVWLSPVFDTRPWTKSKHVVDCGPLGPYGRAGWFIPTDIATEFWSQNIFIDHWRALRLPQVIARFSLNDSLSVLENVMTKRLNQGAEPLCKEKDCVNGFLLGPGCKYLSGGCLILLSSYPEMNYHLLQSQINTLNLPVIVAWIGHYLTDFVRQRAQRGLPVLFYDWWPSPLTLNHNFTQIKFPSCPYDPNPIYCNFKLNQLTKMTSPALSKLAPRAYEAVSRMSFTQEEYADLLQFYSNAKSLRPSIRASKVACSWVKDHEHIWKRWFPKIISTKKRVYLGGLFPLTGPFWTQPGLIQSAEMAIEWVNADTNVLPNHELHLLIKDTQCRTDVAMRSFIDLATNTTIPIAGILGPGCTDEAEPIAAISKHFNMIIVSYSAGAASLNNKQKYPYFFRTVPHINYYRYVYEKLFLAMNWLQIGAIAEVGKEFTEYHRLLKDHLHSRGVYMIARNKMMNSRDPLDLSKIFADLRRNKIHIIIGDFFDYAARLVMCEAYRQRMTSYEGYAWFLPAWLSEDWWDVDYYNSPPGRDDTRPQEAVPCSTEEMEEAVEGYFILSKSFYNDNGKKSVAGDITVNKFRSIYAVKAGKANNDESTFAGYVYDAVWVFAYALDKLLKSNPSALEALHTPATTSQLVQYINETKFDGVSGHISFQGGERIGTINILQYFHNETRLIGQYIPTIHNNPRINIRGSTPPVASGNEEIDNGILRLYKRKVRWLSPNGKPPADGRQNEKVTECHIEKFRAFLNVNCEMAVILANVMAFGFFSIIISVVLIIIRQRYCRRNRGSNQKMEELGLLSTRFSRCLSLDGWELPRDNVVLNRKLGAGAFGTVFGGEAFLDDQGWQPVAVKTLKVGSTIEQKLDFLSEAEMMKRFNHPNIVQLLGVCTQGEPIYTIMEFMLHGDLKTYLLSRRSLVDRETIEAEDVAPFKLTQMATDVANGLNYLHSLKYVHRDLACRNCLVHSNKTVKIGDFGMTRSLYESDFYKFSKKGMLPVRWMSPESIWDGIFTALSDIWSFGVLLYEIVTFGSFPYQGLSNNQVLEYIRSGSRITLPDSCSIEVRTLIYSCMAFNPSERIKLDDILQAFSENTEYLQPCLDVPSSSVALEGTYSIEIAQQSGQTSLSHNTSHTLLQTSPGATSEVSTMLRKNSPGGKLSAKAHKSGGHLFGRPRSNSSIAPFNNSRGSVVMTVQNFHMSSPQIRMQAPSSVPIDNKVESSNVSDQVSEVSRELCQTVTSV
ncbi:uncharacterized protein LOC106880693 isoform X4 [Octopus bimaculoides]|uniref:uncharacterized protein LOC106880693 isoform X4 n=1 Tax=Octopus bimaculoides TaxID=37653 RepID=UPI0022E45EFA|nr:uncharacterized protein LOC106880693 isoform X4 [Octopus bimaculoides]